MDTAHLDKEQPDLEAHVHDAVCRLCNAAIKVNAYGGEDPEDRHPCPEDVVYVNVYRVERVCGGCEEGGWYYDAGEPIESRRMLRKESIAAQSQLIQAYKPEQPRHTRFSVIGGPDIEVYVEDHFARPFPAETPHYE